MCLVRCTLVALTLLIPAGALAQNHTPATTFLVKAFLSSTPPPEWRRTFAEATFVYCREFSEKLPRNSPREDDWINSEMNSVNMERLSRLTGSVEFSRWSLANFVNECTEIMGALIKRESLVPNKEAILWVRFIRSLNDTDGMMQHATRLGFVSSDKSSDPHGFVYWSAYRLKIIQTAILPLLEGP